MTVTLSLTPTGTVKTTETEHPDYAAALFTLQLIADKGGYRVNGVGEQGGTLTAAMRPGGVHQASYSWNIREAS